MLLRNASLKDIDDILALQHIAYPDYLHENAATFASRIEHSPDHCWVIEDDACIVAYLLAIVDSIPNLPSLGELVSKPQSSNGPMVLFLHDMVVSPDYRGRGISTQLLDNEVSIATQMGILDAYLVAVHGADKLWERYGFRPLVGNAPAFNLSSYGPTAVLMHMQFTPQIL